MKRKYILGALSAILLLAALFYFYGGSQVPSGQPALRTLTSLNVAEVRDEFNAAKADTRVLLLLSPT
ncbi:MAG TPA: hypothetical protein VEV17_22355 [Bryobacteraceae bacterium]|nr:hypothetical protein [Bryobacteraceae bacterium]